MALQIKKIELTHRYVHNYPQTNTYHTSKIKTNNAPTLSDVTKTFEQLQDLVRANNHKALAKALRSDFIVELGDTVRTGRLHTDTYREQQGDYYTHQKYSARPVFEQLLLAAPEQFQALLNQAQGEAKVTLLAVLNEIDLDHNEEIDFTQIAGIQDVGASFEGAKLGRSNFTSIKLSGMNFDRAHISHCTITQEQLDTTVSYDGAKVPNGCYTYWGSEVKSELRARFDHLETYAKKHLPEGDNKRKKVDTLCDTYRAELAADSKTHITSTRKQAMIQNLQETKAECSTHRNLRYLVAEVLSFIGLAGVGYLIAASVKAYQTGHFGLFSQPKSEQRALELTQTAESLYRPMVAASA